MIKIRTDTWKAEMASDPIGGLAQLHLAGNEWHQNAACQGHPNPDLWYSDDRRDKIEAATICLDCPVRAICEQKADERRERWGIHGGLDYRAKKRNPALCNHGHRIADNIHTRAGKYLACGTCDNERLMAAKQAAREEAA